MGGRGWPQVRAAWHDRSGVARASLWLAGLVLIALGVVGGAFLTDGVVAAAALPLTGALLMILVVRPGRVLAVFLCAFAASMAGEALAYATGAMSSVPGVSPALSTLVSLLVLGLAYGLVWWVSSQLMIATATSARATAAERRALDLNERLLETLEPQKVLSVIADSLKSVVRYDNLTIYRIDREAGVFRPVLARDRFAALILANAPRLDMGLTGWAVSHQEAVCCNDSMKDPRVHLIPGTPDEEESLIVVPLFINGQVAGTLNVGRMGGKDSWFDEDEFAVTKLFARQASIAIQNAEAHFALWMRAETDALTGLRNRGAFEEDLSALLADKSGKPLTLVMIDLDAFKDFNDRNGHRAGDALLASIARSISSSVRTGDRAYRYGGDEFAVILPGTLDKVGAEVAGRVMAAVAETTSAIGTYVTASAGVATVRTGVASREDLVEAADGALYKAKAAGGDGVAVHDRAASRGSFRAGETRMHST